MPFCYELTNLQLDGLLTRLNLSLDCIFKSLGQNKIRIFTFFIFYVSIKRTILAIGMCNGSDADGLSSHDFGSGSRVWRFLVNPLSPKTDQRQISPWNINPS